MDKGDRVTHVASRRSGTSLVSYSSPIHLAG